VRGYFGLVDELALYHKSEPKGVVMDWLIVLCVALPIAMLVLIVVRTSMQEGVSVVCPNCSHYAKVLPVNRGSLLIEIVLWLTFIIPGLLYSIWRLDWFICVFIIQEA
jgi:hypothetical protein